MDQLLEDIFDYFGIIDKQYNLSYDHFCSDPAFIKDMELEYHKIDCELEDAASATVPAGLTRERAEQLYMEKERSLKQVLVQMQMQKAHQPHLNIDIERSLQLTKVKFDDMMFV